MCDAVRGELLIYFHAQDTVAFQLMELLLGERIDGFGDIQGLDERLHAYGLEKRALPLRIYKATVPEGEETFRSSQLQARYTELLFDTMQRGEFLPTLHERFIKHPEDRFQVAPNSILTRSGQIAVAPVPIQFTKTHHDYKQILGVDNVPSLHRTTQVLVLDSGIDPAFGNAVVMQRNFIDEQNICRAPDDTGHGTAIASIIEDVCPGVELAIYKVIDYRGYATEWDVLTGLLAFSQANIINLSIEFGFRERNCRKCGRATRAARSTVFQSVLTQLEKLRAAPIIVAAAGNDGDVELAYPAKFGNVLAIESGDLNYDLSTFSNRSNVNHENGRHDYVFMLPGGNRADANTPPHEYIGLYSDGSEIFGTSFAAAYGSGLIAALWGQANHSSKNASQMKQHLAANADQSSIPNYDQAIHGNGLMKFQ